MPGVNVLTQTRSGPAPATGPTSSRYMVAGLAERGSTTGPILLRSMADYDRLLGARVAYGYLYDDLKTFFEEGGAEALVARVVGAAATAGTLTLSDRAGVPLPTLKLDAASPGAWSSRLKVQVAAGTVAGSYKIVVSYDDLPVHEWDNLVTPADAVVAATGSTWVKVTDLGSLTAAPQNQPAVQAATPLSAGADDRAAVVAANVSAALDRIGEEWGAGAVACPGYTASQVGAAMLTHAKTFNRVALIGTAKTDTVAQAKTAAAALVNANNGEYGAVIYPWVLVPDGVQTRAIPPEGYAAACRARAHRQIGPWKAPAGEIAVAKYVSGPYVALSRAQGDDLNGANVSAIRTIQGTTRLYGWRSLSTDRANYSLLLSRDVINYLAGEAARLLEPYVFATIDGRGQLLGRVKSTIIGLVDPIRAAGGLFERFDENTGERVDPGYSVDVSNNSVEQFDQSKISAVLAVRVSPVGELIELTIVKAGLSATV
jgi:hypothetical protein